MLEIPQLQYFLAAARSGSFRRAAESLGIRQSSISRGVRRLEDHLGVSLFERSHAGVRLTDAGRRFLEEALPALDRLDQARKLAGAAGRGETGVVRVGILTSLAGGFLRELVHSYVIQNPDVRVDVHDGGREDHVAAIRSRSLDIAFLTGARPVPNCETAELWRERVHVALPRGHELARRRKLDWADLRGETFIVRRFAPGPEVHDYIVRRFAGHNTRPDVVTKDVAQETLMSLVGLGQGVTLVTAARTAVKFPGLVLRPLTSPEDFVAFNAVWSADNDNPALRRFISTAHMLAGRMRRGASDWSVETINRDPAGGAPSADARKPDRSP